MGKIIDYIPPLAGNEKCRLEIIQQQMSTTWSTTVFEQNDFDKRTSRRHACETQRNFNGQNGRKDQKKNWRNISKNRSKVWLFILAVLFIDIAATWPFIEISVWISQLSLFLSAMWFLFIFWVPLGFLFVEWCAPFISKKVSLLERVYHANEWIFISSHLEGYFPVFLVFTRRMCHIFNHCS